MSQQAHQSSPYAYVRFVSPSTAVVTQYLFVINDRPRDFPDAYVVRRWVIGDGPAVPTTDMQTAPTLDAARCLIPEGRHRIPRQVNDDLAIVEVWI